MFKDELGTLRDTTMKHCVKPNAVPRFYKPWSVPFAMKHKVEKELERLQQLGIIESIKFSDWVAPIAPVLKDDGTVHICGDYKLTINQAAKLETYPIPRVEDLFSMLAGGKTFTKLDMSHAYQQLLLDEMSNTSRSTLTKACLNITGWCLGWHLARPFLKDNGKLVAGNSRCGSVPRRHTDHRENRRGSPRSGSYEDVTGRAATKTMQMFIPGRECNIPGTSNISPVPLSRARKSQRHQGSSQAGKHDKT